MYDNVLQMNSVVVTLYIYITMRKNVVLCTIMYYLFSFFFRLVLKEVLLLLFSSTMYYTDLVTQQEMFYDARY